MSTERNTAARFRLVAATALAAGLLAGCSGASPMARMEKASRADIARSAGQQDRSIAAAENAVSKLPRDAGVRAALGTAYLRAGRFESAATAFDDAMQLGDNSGRTALSFALAQVGAGRNADAVAVLDDWRDAIPAADLGLALALAGETSRGVAILATEARDGESTAKLRQNLAYAYALDGRWAEARIVAAQDVPADQLDSRLSEWAQAAKPEDATLRVARLLGVTPREDAGMPQRLALANTPSAEQLAAEAAALAPQPVAEVQPAVAAAEAPAEPSVAVAVAPAPAPSMVVESVPVVQPVAESRNFAAAFPAAAPVARATPRPAAVQPRSGGSHLVQLGSFSSPQGARRAWGVFTARNPALRGYKMTITPAVVNGRNFWRVAAAGFDGRSAAGMCSTVKARGGACFAYAATRAPAPGRAVGTTGPMRARR